MYKTPQNDEVRLIVIDMQGPLRTVMSFIAHIPHVYKVITDNFNVCAWMEKVEQNSSDDLATVLLDV